MNPIDYSSVNKESLSHNIIVNEMISSTGCTDEQAKQLLILTEWKLQAAINLFFDERTTPIPCCKVSEFIVPSNTPVTPPNFPETLLTFEKLSTSENHSNNNQINTDEN